MSSFFNLASLCLGLISWVVPFLHLKRKTYSAGISGISYLCCALALLLQLTEVRHRASIGDLAAVMDTINAVVFAGAVMVGVCALLNLAAILKSRK